MRHLFEFVAERQRLTDALRTNRNTTTDDPVFQHLPFSYIVREEDGATRWFNHQIRSKLHDPDEVLLACVAFRWFGTVQAGSLLKPWLLRERPWNEKQILLEIESSGKTILHGMRVPDGVRREAAILSLIRPFTKVTLGSRAERDQWPMKHMHQVLSEFNYLSPELAYDIVSDLRHTSVLDQADDINHWAYVSPQVCRAMGYLVSDDPLEYVFGHARTNRGMLSLMRELLEEAWTLGYSHWEMREVESALHEFHRYRVAQQGQFIHD